MDEYIHLTFYKIIATLKARKQQRRVVMGYLVFTRRPGQSIIIGEGEEKIIVTVTKIEGAQARIAISAPPNISVDREEVRERKNKK